MASTIDQIQMNTEIEKIKKDLFKMAMKGQWENVVKIYREHKTFHNAKLTSSGDTALHIAVSDGQEKVVRKLVRCISAHPDGKDVLQIKNDQRSTPLHIAASTGNVAMCECIAKVDPSLVGARNVDNETPFYLAALYGKKDSFLRLQQICGTEKGYEYSRGRDGDTILHCAIAGDYFDLAFRIIHLYEEKLVNSFNEKGWTPLHLLASKPSAFRSGSHLGGYYEMIYYCIFVDKLEHESPDYLPKDNQNLKDVFVEELEMPILMGPENDLDDQKKQDYPKNYRTCLDFLQFFWNVVSVVVNGVRKDAQNHETSNVKSTAETKSELATDVENPKAEAGFNATNGVLGHQLFPANYGTCFEFVKFASKAMLAIFGPGQSVIRKIEEKKQKHTWAVQIMEELLLYTSLYEYDNTGVNPYAATISPTVTETMPYDIIGNTVEVTGESPFNYEKPRDFPTNQEDENKEYYSKDKSKEVGEKQKKNGVIVTPILIAAKNGVTEMVEKILELFPIAKHDMDEEKKNIVLLAVEHRQQHLCEFLLKKNIIKDSMFYQLDCYGNSALHLAANIVNFQWPVPGASSQMQWEIKWCEYIKSFVPKNILFLRNNEGKTPDDIFTESHKKLVDDGGQWLSRTSEACTVVAGLFVTATYTTSTTVPGGVKQESGTPYLEHKMSFQIFAVSSFLSFYSSLIAVVMFLAIFTSGCRERDFHYTLPVKLFMGLTAFYVSIASTLISFSTGHFFILKDQLKSVAFPLYIGVCLLVTFFSIAVFPLYFHLAWATFKKVPQRNYQVTPL